MKRICIISDIHDWHSKKIKSELIMLGYKVYLIKFDDLSVQLTNSKNIILFKNKHINFEGIWVRFIIRKSLEDLTFKLSILHILRDSKIYIHNSGEIIEKTVDKSRTSMILKLNKINVPKTWVFNLKKKEKNLSFFNNKKLLISKPLFGSQGKGIELFKNKKALKKIETPGGIYYIQRFIGKENSKTHSDYRVLVSNHRVISVIKRTSKSKITNVSRGAKIEKVIIDKKIKYLAEKISKVFNLGYGGIDIKNFKNKNYILEINSIPSWKGLQTVESKNITKILVRDFIFLIKKLQKIYVN